MYNQLDSNIYARIAGQITKRWILNDARSILGRRQQRLTTFNDNLSLVAALRLSFIIITALVWHSCAVASDVKHNSASAYNEKPPAVYFDLMAELETSGQIIDYDTLVYIKKTISHHNQQIKRKDRLIKSLIYKRNKNPRIDQMILIFAAQIIRESKVVVPDASEIFKAILKMDDNRINAWVIAYVADAIGKYAFELPDGNHLADMLEAKLDQVTSSGQSRKEYFGFHFLPPPKSDFIRMYIAKIKQQKDRESERTAYYGLIRNKINEIKIESAVKYIQKYGSPCKGEKITWPMQYLLLNTESVFNAMKAEAFYINEVTR